MTKSKVTVDIMHGKERTSTGKMRPGHFWLLKFGKVPGSNSCVEKKFKLGTRKYEEYKNRRTQVEAAREDMWCLRACFI